MTRIAAALLAATLAACAPTMGEPQTAVTPEQGMQIACRAWAASLTTLAGYRAADRLSEAEVMTVESYRPHLNAACSEDTVATGDLLDQVEAYLIQVLIIEQRAQ